MTAGLTPQQLSHFVLQLGLLLLVARTFGELFSRWHQPPVFGELIGGILLGPSVLGLFAPGAFGLLFPDDPIQWKLLDGFSWLAALLLLLAVGIEVDLRSVRRQGRSAFITGFFGILIPFALGAGLGAVSPDRLVAPGTTRTVFTLFLATAMSITAIPVVARILLDLRLIKTDVGLLILSAGMLDDVAGWLVLSVIISVAAGHAPDWMSVGGRALAVAAFFTFAITLGTRMVGGLLRFVERHATGSAGILSLVIGLGLLCGMVSESLGIHVIFGAYVAGIMIGQSPRMTERTREEVKSYIFALFTPIFFATVGLKVNLLGEIDPLFTAVALGIACAGKILGGTLGARLAGMSRWDAISVGIGVNVRGAMELLIATIGLRLGLITQPVFTALVFIAIATSLMAGPLLQWSLRRRRPLRLVDLLHQEAVTLDLFARNREAAIEELIDLLAQSGLLADPEGTLRAVRGREEVQCTGVGDGVAFPHGRVAREPRTVIAFGRSGRGIDFDAPDGIPARLIFLIVSPMDDAGAQVKAQAILARALTRPEVRQGLLEAKTREDAWRILAAVPDATL